MGRHGGQSPEDRVQSDSQFLAHQAIRALLPKCWFDEKKCGPGLEALREYRREFNEKAHDFVDAPCKDWTSHGVAAFRYLAQGLKPVRERDAKRATMAMLDYDPFA